MKGLERMRGRDRVPPLIGGMTRIMIMLALVVNASQAGAVMPGIIDTYAGGYPPNAEVAVMNQIGDPWAMTLDGSGSVIFSTNRSVIWKLSGQFLTRIAGIGLSGSTGDGGLATSAQISLAQGLAYNSNEDLFIADTSNQKIRVVDRATGNISTFAGTGASGSAGDGGPAIAAQFIQPSGIAFNPRGDLYIADSGNHKIRKIDHETGIISTAAGTGVAGFAGDGGAASSAQFNSPYGLAFNSSGDLFVGDSNNHRIRMINHATGIITTVAGGGSSGDGAVATSALLYTPTDLAFDAAGNLYITDSNVCMIRKVNFSTGVITTVAGGGSYDSTYDNRSATSVRLLYPHGIALDSSGDLFIAVSFDQLVRQVNPLTQTIVSVAGGYKGVTHDDAGSATQAQLDSPIGLAFDSFGNFHIADSYNRKVREVVRSSGNVVTLAGDGTLGDSGDGGPATFADLGSPNGLAINSSDDIFISDPFSYKVRKVDHSTKLISTYAGNGNWGYFGDGKLATSANLNGPYDLAIDSNDDLYIADPYTLVSGETNGKER